MSKRSIVVDYSDDSDLDCVSNSHETRVIHRIRRPAKRFGEIGELPIEESDSEPTEFMEETLSTIERFQ